MFNIPFKEAFGVFSSTVYPKILYSVSKVMYSEVNMLKKNQKQETHIPLQRTCLVNPFHNSTNPKVNNTRDRKFKCCKCSTPSDPDSGSWCYHISFVSLKMIYHYGEANLRHIINSSGFNLDLFVPFFQSCMVIEAGPRFRWMNSFTINNSPS
jgi:hypothetical protein